MYRYWHISGIYVVGSSCICYCKSNYWYLIFEKQLDIIHWGPWWLDVIILSWLFTGIGELLLSFAEGLIDFIIDMKMFDYQNCCKSERKFPFFVNTGYMYFWIWQPYLFAERLLLVHVKCKKAVSDVMILL